MSKINNTQAPDQFEKKIQIKNKIIEFLLQQKSGVGVSVNQILKGVGDTIVRQTVHNHLRELISDRIVRKRNHQYFLVDHDLHQRYWCGQTLSDGASVLIKPDLTGPGYPESVMEDRSTDYVNNFSELVSEPLPSKEFCKLSFNKSDKYEEFFFDFANRIGAYVLFIFLESMRSSQFDNTKLELDLTKHNLRKKFLSMELIFRSINLEMFYDLFRERLKDIEFNRMILNNSKKKLPNYPHEPRARKFNNSEYLEMEDTDFKRLWKKYERIYPTLYHGLNMYWDEATAFVGLDLEILESMFKGRSSCKHKWKEVKIYRKRGKYFECLKCFEIANEWLVNKHQSRKN
jgi:hypothetical protein